MPCTVSIIFVSVFSIKALKIKLHHITVAITKASSPPAKMNYNKTVSPLISTRLLERAEVIARTVISQQEFYANSSVTANQRQLLETVIGASIWYLPQSESLWTGDISIEALKALGEASSPKKIKLTKDHHYPRKVAAAELFALDWSAIEDQTLEVAVRYINRYGKFNYVLPEENKSLVKYQKTHNFISPVQSYADAGIELRHISGHLLKAILNGDSELAKLAVNGDAH